jgi:hypothetical protein
MRCNDKMFRNVTINDRNKKTGLFNSFLCFWVAFILLGGGQLLYGQGSLGETVTTVGLQEELAGSEKATTPKPANAQNPKPSMNQQGIEKLEKAAQKLTQSMQTGNFESADFSAIWSTLVPKDMSFSDGINSICKPVFDQFGKPEKLGPGTMAGNNKAVFPVQFTKGSLNMTVSLDPQDKIVEWTLTPASAPAALTPPAQAAPPAPASAVPALTAPAATPKTETQPPPVEQLKETNEPDITDFNSFQRELNLINIRTKNEEQRWLGPIEKKEDMLRSMDELVAAELRFIRKLAESEHSEQLVKAVDLVLRQRQDRLNKLITKLEEGTKPESQQQTGERRRPPRTGTTEQVQPRERTQRRPPKETTTENQQ